ncbi:MAG: methyltransferase domain-containing protein [Sphingomonadales bacterium]|nr:methyltransferase domain-containing protein [Sphingomonadales bacterium]
MSETSQHNARIVDQHTQQASGYAKLTQSMSGERPKRHELIGARPDDVLLDIACGPGSLTLELAPHVTHATGFDITPAMLEQARAAQAQKGLTNVDWVQGNAEQLPFPDGAFSLVTCSAAFHHFEQPAAILAEMRRVCRPGGRIVVSDVTPEAGKAAAYDRMEKMRDPSHGHAHPVAELAAIGTGLGMGEPRAQTSLTGPMPYAAVLATSFPEEHSRDELLGLMRADAEAGADELGFKAELAEGEVMVTYPMSTVIWTKP